MMSIREMVGGAQQWKIAPELIDQASLLRTKLFIPPLRSNTVSRERLIDRLRAEVRPRLILVSAPAGFGKTTFIAEWLARLRQQAPENRTAWLQLEEADNELGRFWRYVIAALQSIDPCIGLKLIGLLHRSPPPFETWLPELLHDLGKVAGSAVLVLDDYHVIHTRAIHQSLNYLLQHLTPNVSLVLSTRADPPLPLARLRVQDELIELRGAELLFSSDEIERYLNTVLGIGLANEDLALLARRTEGWPAGVHLVARSLQGIDAANRGGFIRSFSGSNRFVLNFLLEEVLQQQQPPVWGFLLQTSVLPRLTASLCSAVTGQTLDASRAILDRLVRDHLFIIPLDTVGRWFRYHPLFAEALETRLREESAELWSEVHRRAGHWYAANVHAEWPASNMLSGDESDAVMALLEAVSDRARFPGGLAPFLRWLDSLPASTVDDRLALHLLDVWSLLLHDRPGDESTDSLEAGTARSIGSANAHPLLRFQPDTDLALLDHLTPREAEILMMIARGASNQEIADRLVLSVGTVKGHVNHIFSKLDVHNRTAAVARARDFQLLSS